MSKKAQVKTKIDFEKTTESKSLNKIEVNGLLLFNRKNYQLMILGLVLIFIGYLLMMGKNNDVESLTAVFPKEEVYSVRRIILAPVVIILGFVIEIYAVLSAKKQSE